MREVHFFTSSGPLCEPGLSSKCLTIVARSVTCAACLAALEDRSRDDLRWSAHRPRLEGRPRALLVDE